MRTGSGPMHRRARLSRSCTRAFTVLVRTAPGCATMYSRSAIVRTLAFIWSSSLAFRMRRCTPRCAMPHFASSHRATRRSEAGQIFECLISGSIPVFFTSCPGGDMVYERLYEPFLPRFDRTEFGLGTWAVVLDSRRAENEEGYTMAALARIARDADAIRKVQRTILSLMPRLMYPEPSYVSSDCHAEGVQEPNALVILREVLTSRGLPDIWPDCRKHTLSSPDIWPSSARGLPDI